MNAEIFTDPILFGQLVSFFFVPLGILIFSWLVQRHFKARLNAGVEFFAFLASLDFAFLAQTDSGSQRINPLFTEHYYPLFVGLVIVSLLSLAYAARVQAIIYTHLSLSEPGGQIDRPYYPFQRVLICWVIALTAISSHLFIVLGGNQC